MKVLLLAFLSNRQHNLPGAFARYGRSLHGTGAIEILVLSRANLCYELVPTSSTILEESALSTF